LDGPQGRPSDAEGLNLTEILLDANVSRGSGNRPALLHRERVFTYDVLLAEVNRMAALLRSRGIAPEDRVILRIPNTPEFVICSLAVQRLGGICVPTHVQLKARELIHIANDSGASLLVSEATILEEVKQARTSCRTVREVLVLGRSPGGLDSNFIAYQEATAGVAESCVEPVRVDENAAALLLYTSGTSGESKGCIHTHRSYLAVAECYGRQVLGATHADVFGGTPSLAFAYGHTGLLAIPLYVGASVSLSEARFDPEAVFTTIAQHQVTVFYGVPTAYRMMLARFPEPAQRFKLSSLRVAVTAGEPCPPALHAQWIRATGVELLEHLGTTEMFDGFLSARLGDAKPGCLGLPVPGYTVRVVDEAGGICPPLAPGRLAVIGPTGTRYWNATNRQRQAVSGGWNYTGDIVYHDHEGRYWYVGREDDLIKSAGYRISPLEVEQVLLEHPGVHEAAVVGIPDPMRGVKVVAFVVLGDPAGASPELARVLIDFVGQRIAAYKVPRGVEFRRELPRTINGKLSRARLVSESQVVS
jgi:2-aminobenzoate-CoA ligase